MSAAKWAAARAPVHDALERDADIPNGERALARFTASYMRNCRTVLSLNVGTLYLSKSYAVFSAHHVNVSRDDVRLVLPLSKVRSIKPANFHRVLKNGVCIRVSDDDFLFMLGKKQDQQCAVRLVTVLSYRARSGAHLHPQSAIAVQNLITHHNDKPPQRELDRYNTLTFESRSRHRRRRSRDDLRENGKERQLRASPVSPFALAYSLYDEHDDIDGDRDSWDEDSPLRPKRESPRRRNRNRTSSRTLKSPAKWQIRPPSPPPPLHVEETVLDERQSQPRAALLKSIVHEFSFENVKSKITGLEMAHVYSFVDNHLVDLALLTIAFVAIVIAFCILQVSNLYTVRLHLIGVLLQT